MRIADLIARERSSLDIDDDATFARWYARVEALCSVAMDAARELDRVIPAAFRNDTANELHAAVESVIAQDWPARSTGEAP